MCIKNAPKYLRMLDGLMKQFEETQKKMNEQLAAEIIEVQDNSKQISIKVNGNNTLLDLSIDEQMLKVENKEMIEDLLIDTLNQAMALAKQKQNEASQNSVSDILPGGMNLGNLFGS